MKHYYIYIFIICQLDDRFLKILQFCLIFCNFTFFFLFLVIYILNFISFRESTLMVDGGSYEVASPATTRHENYTRLPRKKEIERVCLCESDVRAGCGRRTLALLNFLLSPCLPLLLSF